MASKCKRSGKKTGKRISKENRKNLRLWAEGAREDVLRPHIEAYADALERGWRAERDYLQQVCNEFHARIPWRLADHEEPALPLAAYDPLVAIPAEDLTEEEEAEERARVQLLNARIHRWFKYRVRRLRKGFHSKLDPLNDPWSVLLSQLSGLKNPPKARQAYQQFMKEAYTSDILPVVTERWADETSAGSNVQMKKEPNINFKNAIARELFASLPDSEREDGKRAKEQAAAAKAAYEAGMKAGPSKTPEDRSACIKSVGEFLGPILKGIHERTGLHCTMIMGGPIPHYNGELGTVYASCGRNRATGGDAHFPDWAGARWNLVSDLMKEYLVTAFSPQERAEAALPEDPLANAKYTLARDSGSESDSESDSDHSDSDSNADSDDTNPAPRKKQKTAEKGAAVRRGKKKAVASAGDVEGGEEGRAAGRKGKKRAVAPAGDGEGGEDDDEGGEEDNEGGRRAGRMTTRAGRRAGRRTRKTS
ncbi:hypothetical protein C8F04DRAFT_1265718 [Mycena alexandri]|uniref:Uncharacterized protein n=1 Tax=Mycena alexandri TaxID=1745969 RepID=A0AAD6SIN8_9AGAR|nr:hypothetical protein C8F04DRAFT_1265718 [Mycena alexandri]